MLMFSQIFIIDLLSRRHNIEIFTLSKNKVLTIINRGTELID